MPAQTGPFQEVNCICVRRISSHIHSPDHPDFVSPPLKVDQKKHPTRYVLTVAPAFLGRVLLSIRPRPPHCLKHTDRHPPLAPNPKYQVRCFGRRWTPVIHLIAVIRMWLQEGRVRRWTGRDASWIVRVLLSQVCTTSDVSVEGQTKANTTHASAAPDAVYRASGSISTVRWGKSLRA